MKKKAKGLNTFYLKKWRREARERYRVVTTVAGYVLQEWVKTVWGAYEYTFSDYRWINKELYDDKNEAYAYCDRLRRDYILYLCKEKKAHKTKNVGEIY